MVTADRRPASGAELVPAWRGGGRQVRRVWAAYAISQVGSGIGTGALPLVAILLLDASDWQISLLAAMAGIAGAAAVVPLGPLVEFHRKRPVMIGADLLRGVTLLSVPVAAWAGGLTFGQLCLVAAAQTIGTILSSAASTAYLKSLVPADRQVLVNARWESTMWTASTLGPPAGGMLVSWLGALAALLVDAASFLLSALTLGRIRHREPAPAAPETGRHSLAEMTAGWRHIAAHPVLVRLFGHALILLPVQLLMQRQRLQVSTPVPGGSSCRQQHPRHCCSSIARALIVAGSAQ
jgi:hypothetical protein